MAKLLSGAMLIVVGLLLCVIAGRLYKVPTPPASQHALLFADNSKIVRSISGNNNTVVQISVDDFRTMTRKPDTTVFTIVRFDDWKSIFVRYWIFVDGITYQTEEVIEDPFPLGLTPTIRLDNKTLILEPSPSYLWLPILLMGAVIVIIGATIASGVYVNR